MKRMIRRVSQSLKDGTFYLNLWCDSEDEEQFKVRAVKTKPYIIAYGIRYDLTKREQLDMKALEAEYRKLKPVIRAIDAELKARFGEGVIE